MIVLRNRVIAAAFALGFIVANSVLGVANVLAEIQPQMVLRIVPGHSVATEVLSAQYLSKGLRDSRRRRQFRNLAMTAHQADPTYAGSLRNFAQIAAIEGRQIEARKLYRLAFQISRRDLLTTLNMIDIAARSGDASGALNYYDVAMRSAPAARPMLMPSLANGFKEPELHKHFVALAKTNPPWFEQFSLWMVERKINEEPLAELIIASKNSRLAHNEELLRNLIHTLVDEERLELAMELYRSFHQSSLNHQFVDVSFRDGKRLPPFDWSIASTNGIAEGFGARISGARLEYWSNGGAGLLGQKMLLMKPGKYRLDVWQQSPNHALAEIETVLVCPKRANDIARLTIVKSAASVDFIVPSDCPTQWINVFFNRRISEYGNVEIRGYFWPRILKLIETEPPPEL